MATTSTTHDSPAPKEEKVKAPKETIIKLPSGFKVAGKTWGSASSPVKVLAIHGWLDNAASFDTLAPLLVSRGMHMICIDLVGHGRSQHTPPECEPSFISYVLQVIDVGYALGWESYHLIGHSMGAGVAVLVASTIPNTIRSLVLFDGLGPYSSTVSAARQFEDAVVDRRKYMNRNIKTYASVAECVKKLQSNNHDIAEHTAKAIVQRGTIQVEGGWQFCHDPRLLSKPFLVFREPDVISHLERIRCPVLIFWAQITADRFKLAQSVQKDKTVHPEEEESVGFIIPQSVPAASSTEQQNSSASSSSSKVQTKDNKGAAPSSEEPVHIIGVLKRLPIETRMASIQHLQVEVVPGSHHVHSDNPQVVAPHILKFLLPPMSKL